MTKTLNIIAFEDDVRLLNANSTHPKYGHVSRTGKLVSPIGPPLSVAPLAPRINLFAHEAVFSAKGYADLAEAARTDPIATRLRLTEGETFGMLLAQWRDLYGMVFGDKKAKDFGAAACKIARYKAHLAVVAGNEREAKRLLVVHDQLIKEFKAKRDQERKLQSGIKRSLKSAGWDL